MNEVNWLVSDVIIYGLQALVSAKDVTHRYFKYYVVPPDDLHECSLFSFNTAVEKCASYR